MSYQFRIIMAISNTRRALDVEDPQQVGDAWLPVRAQPGYGLAERFPID
jgi:hypothetical protein